MNEEDQLIVKRVVKAQVWLMLDDDAIKALSSNVPITFSLGEKMMKTVKEAVETYGDIEINLARKKKDEE